MTDLSRREFIKRTSAAGLFVSAAGLPVAAPRRRVANAYDQVPLGNTGIQASFLAQGTGIHGSRQSSEHTRMGLEACTRLIRHGLDLGLNFIDAADLYGTHTFIAKALQGVPRERYVLLSKIWTRQEDWLTPSGGAFAEVDRFRKELDTDVLDVCLIHCMTHAGWDESQKRTRDELSALKERGTVRAVGVSCHDFGALRTAARDPWTDVIFARINYMGGREYSMDGTAQEIADTLRTARANGKAVVGMKIYGVGKLTGPEQMDRSLRYVMGNDLVDAMTIGMLRPEEMDDNIRRIRRAAEAVNG